MLGPPFSTFASVKWAYVQQKNQNKGNTAAVTRTKRGCCNGVGQNIQEQSVHCPE